MSKPSSLLSWLLLPSILLALPAGAGPASPATGGASAAPGPGLSRRAQTLHEHLAVFARELEDRLVRVGREAAAGRAPEPGLAAETLGLRRHLELLEGQIHRLPPGEAEALRGKVRALENVLGNLELAASGRHSLEELATLDRTSTTEPQTLELETLEAAPRNDDCASAPLIGNGTFLGTTTGATNDGSATCGASASSPDVWYRYVGSSFSDVSVDTFGSDYDTVLSVHTSCPGTTGNQRTCNDDALGLQSAVSFFLFPGDDVFLRVSGFNGATGDLTLNVGFGGGVTGAVTATGGGPVTGGVVKTFRVSGFFESSGSLGGDGTYTVAGLPAGEHFVRTDTGAANLVDELYDGVACLGSRLSDCDTSAATPVGVGSVGLTDGIDFALDRGGSVAGTVTRTVTGDPIPGVRVEIWRDDGGVPDLVGSRLSDDGGAYEVGGLLTGIYYAVAESSEFGDERYQELACPGGAPFGCDPTTGTAISVTDGAVTAGVDFTLDRLGSIAGRVTEAGTGEPLSGVRVRIFHDTGSFPDFVGSTLSDATGDYELGGLGSGIYFAVTDSLTFADQLFKGLPCEPSCDVSTGTPITVAAEAVAANIDFSLERLGEIAGTVTEAATGSPLPGVRVEVFDSRPSFRRSATTDVAGNYRVERLAAGTYFVLTDNFSTSFLDELYDDLPCELSCSPTTGTPVPVANDATTAGIDFALDRGGAFAGTVTNALTGAPVPSLRIEIWNAAGALVRSPSTGVAGEYRAAGLPAGDYFVSTDSGFFGGFLDELYDDVPCIGGAPSGCDPTKGTPVPVTLGVTTAGIDIALTPRLAGIAGTVRARGTGEPAAGIFVDIWNAAGTLVESTVTPASGMYFVPLPAGTYFVSTGNAGGFIDQVYQDVVCFLGSAFDGFCNPLAGTPVTVGPAALPTTGVDFFLGAVLFRDGFESGDLSAWSAAVGTR